MLWQFALFQRFSLVFPITCQEKERLREIRVLRYEEKKDWNVLIGEIKNLNYSLFHRILKIKNIYILLYIKFFIFNALKDIYFFDAKIN